MFLQNETVEIKNSGSKGQADPVLIELTPEKTVLIYILIKTVWEYPFPHKLTNAGYTI